MNDQPSILSSLFLISALDQELADDTLPQTVKYILELEKQLLEERIKNALTSLLTS